MSYHSDDENDISLLASSEDKGGSEHPQTLDTIDSLSNAVPALNDGAAAVVAYTNTHTAVPSPRYDHDGQVQQDNHEQQEQKYQEEQEMRCPDVNINSIESIHIVVPEIMPRKQQKQQKRQVKENELKLTSLHIRNNSSSHPMNLANISSKSISLVTMAFPTTGKRKQREDDLTVDFAEKNIDSSNKNINNLCLESSLDDFDASGERGTLNGQGTLSSPRLLSTGAVDDHQIQQHQISATSTTSSDCFVGSSETESSAMIVARSTKCDRGCEPNSMRNSIIESSRSAEHGVVRGEDTAISRSNSNRTDTKSLTTVSSGRWTRIEHDAFLVGMSMYGREWKKVAEMIPTRSSAQVRSHAQKYFHKLEQQHQQLQQATAESVDEGDYEDRSIGDGVSAETASHQLLTSSSSSLSSPIMQTLSVSARLEVERIISSPGTVEDEVHDTLRRLHERYRGLQIQLQLRQQQRHRQQQQQHQLLQNQLRDRHKLMASPQHRKQEAKLQSQTIENVSAATTDARPEASSLDNTLSTLPGQDVDENLCHVEEISNTNFLTDTISHSAVNTRRSNESSESHSNCFHDQFEGVEDSNHEKKQKDNSISKSVATPITENGHEVLLLRDTSTANNDTSEVNIGYQWDDDDDVMSNTCMCNANENNDFKSKNNCDESDAVAKRCANCMKDEKIVRERDDSSSSLFLLAESVVQVHNEEELVALNVLRNGLYHRQLQLLLTAAPASAPTETIGPTVINGVSVNTLPIRNTDNTDQRRIENLTIGANASLQQPLQHFNDRAIQLEEEDEMKGDTDVPLNGDEDNVFNRCKK